MNLRLITIAVGVAGVSFAQGTSPVATVASRAQITIQGVSAPVVGSTAWPVAAGDVIQTSSAPAELRLKNGTRIFVPPSSRFVVGAPVAESGGGVGARADLGVRAASGAPMVALPSQRGAGNAVVNVLSGGAILVGESAARQELLWAPRANAVAGTAPATLSLAALIASYGPNSTISTLIAQAMTLKNTVIQQGANGSYYITGIEISNNGAITAGTIVINPPSATNPTGSVTIYNTTVTPTTTNPPAPISTVTPPPAGSGSPTGCKGTSFSPVDVSNGVISTVSLGSC